MNTAVAHNVRVIREHKHWTQIHLAETAGVDLRTVQRVEKGEGASLETLKALSSAFDISIEFLQTDFQQLERAARAQLESLKQTHHLVDVKPVTCAAHLEVIGGSDAAHMQCTAEDERARDVFAQLESELQDVGDLWSDVDATQRREWMKAAYEHVAELNGLGLTICVGTIHRYLPTPKGSLPFKTFVLIAWPQGQEKTQVAIPKHW